MSIWNKILPNSVGNTHAAVVESAIKAVGGDAVVKNGYVHKTSVACNLDKPLHPDQAKRLDEDMRAAKAGCVSPSREVVYVKKQGR